MLQGAVGKSSCGRADIQHRSSRQIKVEPLDRFLQLQPAPADIGMDRPLDRQRGIARYLHSGLLDPFLSAEHQPGHDRGFRLFPAIEISLLHEQDVYAFLGNRHANLPSIIYFFA
ncbi:hypothetical protein D3C74_279940 [compost metagenome]